MTKNPAKHSDKIIDEFFNLLQIENQYYSVQLQQPVYLIGEEHLYQAIKQALENNSSTKH